MMPSTLSSYAAYSQFIYSLLLDRVTVDSHTVAIYTAGQTVGIVRGEIRFHSGYILRVFEQVDFLEARILRYSYEAYDGKQKIWWYDPMPHPRIPSLQNTHPHHKHVPPDIKHNRIPAPNISFTAINLSFLIQEIEALMSHGLTFDV